MSEWKKQVFEGKITDIDIEDGGRAMIAHMDDSDPNEKMFIRIQSWDDTKEHLKMKQLYGATVRVTIEILDKE